MPQCGHDWAARCPAHARARLAEKPWHFSTYLPLGPGPGPGPSWLPGEGMVGVCSVGYGHRDGPALLAHRLHGRVARQHAGWVFSQVEASWEGMAGPRHTRHGPVPISFLHLLPGYSHSPLKPPELLGGWTRCPQHHPCVLSCSAC